MGNNDQIQPTPDGALAGLIIIVIILIIGSILIAKAKLEKMKQIQQNNMAQQQTINNSANSLPSSETIPTP